jgi:hypothetical protein
VTDAQSPPAPDATLPRDAATDGPASDSATDGSAPSNGDSAADAEDGATPDNDGSAATDAGADAYAPTGSECSRSNAVEERLCGFCGAQKRLCLKSGDGVLRWLDWGPCIGEKPDAGLPGTVVRRACKMCGTQTIHYDSQCNATVGFCEPSLTAECEAGETEWVQGLSCSTGQYRTRSCKADCSWDDFGSCTKLGAGSVIVAPSVVSAQDAGTSAASKGTFALQTKPSQTALIGYGTQTCPLSSYYPTTDATAYAYVEVQNPMDRAIVVDLWHSSGDTQMAVYAGTTVPDPFSVDERRLCKAGTSVTDRCTDSLSKDCNGSPTQVSTAGLAGIEIPAKSSIVVWNALSRMPSTGGSLDPLTLNVRTTAIR